MKILVLATDDYLGAGKASLRVYQALKNGGQEVCFLVKNRVNNYDSNILTYADIVPSVKANKLVSVYCKVMRRLRKEVKTDPDYYFFGLNDEKLQMNVKAVVKTLPFVPDIIIATWISGFINPKILFKFQQLTGARIILYPMDISAFTGGCHYSWDCKGYQHECHNCPAILNPIKKEIAHKNWKHKNLYYKKSKLKIIPASHQLFIEAALSSIFKKQQNFEKVLLPIDEEVFNPFERRNAKLRLGLPQEYRIIFFGASLTTEKRKGVHLFVETLIELNKKINIASSLKENIFILLAGHKPTDTTELEKIPFEIHFAGYINDDKTLSLMYQAADVFVSTSIQDSGPMMVNEAIMCGTPVIAFEIGVVKDLIINNVSGFRIPLGDIDSMAKRLFDILEMNFNSYAELVSSTANFGKTLTSYASFNKNFIDFFSI